MPDAEAFASGTGSYPAERYAADALAPQAREEILVEETPVALNYNGVAHAVMMLTPTDLEDFAVGFSLSEGIVASVAEIAELDVLPSRRGVAIMMRIPEARAAALATRRRSLPGSGACGLCGVEQLEDLLREPAALDRSLRIAPAALRRALEALSARQSLGQRTGAAHAAAWVTTDGELRALREDAARHSALDKLLGHLARSGLNAREGWLLLTSRASYELVQKAAFAGIELLAAVSAPTGLAVRLAERSGMTLVGFAREGRFTCYAHGGRIAGH